jgi:hypothetical protein
MHIFQPLRFRAIGIRLADIQVFSDLTENTHEKNTIRIRYGLKILKVFFVLFVIVVVGVSMNLFPSSRG